MSLSGLSDKDFDFHLVGTFSSSWLACFDEVSTMLERPMWKRTEGGLQPMVQEN